MTEISFLLGELLFSAVWIIVRAALWIYRQHADRKREAMLLLMYVNLAVIIRVTFYPFFPVDGKVQPLVFDPAEVFPLWINWVPLVHIAEYDTAIDLLVNIIGNLALFIPSGILLPLLDRRLDSFRKVLAGGACLSLCIELLQLPFSDPRSEDSAQYDTLLLQLDTDFRQGIGLMWGDIGVGNFFINREALKRLDFSDVLYNWDCG